jgi:hypothetical protein
MITKPLHVDMHEQIECAQTLASKFYNDPAILDIEKARIFRHTWQVVSTLNQLCGEGNGVKRAISDPETFFTADVAGEPIVVVRDRQGTLRAFSNVCRHRAAVSPCRTNREWTAKYRYLERYYSGGGSFPSVCRRTFHRNTGLSLR